MNIIQKGVPKAASDASEGTLLMFELGGKTHVGMKGKIVSKNDSAQAVAVTLFPGKNSLPAVYDWKVVGSTVYELPDVQLELPVLPDSINVGLNFDRQRGAIVIKNNACYMFIPDAEPRFPDLFLNMVTGDLHNSHEFQTTGIGAWLLDWKIIQERGQHQTTIIASFPFTA